MRELLEKGEYKSEWISHIRNTLNQLQLNTLWNIPPDYLSPKTLKNLFDENLKWFYCNQWMMQIENYSACDSYSTFKIKLKVEPNLILLEPKYAIPLCKFRTNNLRLPIVTVRFTKMTRTGRMCERCESDVGDEYH